MDSVALDSDNQFVAEALRMKLNREELDSLRTWWNEQSNALFNTYLRKAREYGSMDLDIMGGAMRDIGAAVGPLGGAQAAIMFYSLGKVARAISAIQSGRHPSDDTLQDLIIYTMMAMLINKHGKLPDVRD